MRPFVIMGTGRVSLSVGWFPGMDWSFVRCNILSRDDPVFHVIEFQFLKFVIDFAIADEA